MMAKPLLLTMIFRMIPSTQKHALVGMMFFARRMLEIQPKGEYADIMEKNYITAYSVAYSWMENGFSMLTLWKWF